MRSKIVFMALVLQSFLFWMMIGCTKQQTHYPANNGNTITYNNSDSAMNDTAKNFSWLALGDSYTIGQSVNEDERYPAQTVALLKNDTINVQSLQYIATTG